MSLAFLPLYIKFLGIESYGLIGTYASLRALLAVLDLGLSTTLNRELAQLSAMKEGNQEARDVVRTFEVIYWGAGGLIGTGLVGLAPVIARHWLKAQGLPVATVGQALMIMGVVFAVDWPGALYAGGLMGLERQVLLNGVRATAASFRAGGAVLVLWFISPTIQAYFIWQIVATGLQTLVLAACLWASLPAAGHRAALRKRLWVNKQRFAAGMMGITLLATILTQSDRVVLSKLLALDMFGYYAFAATVGGALSYIAAPVFSGLFPRLSQAVMVSREDELAALYHKGCQLASVAVLPIWIVVALFSKQLLSLWVRQPVVVEHTSLLLSLVVSGTALNSLMLLPLALQLAHGWTRLSFFKNVVAVVTFVPMLVWLVLRFGSIGAAIAWIALNAGYVLVEVPLMHRRILKEEMWRWYYDDVGIPFIIVLTIGLISRMFMPPSAPFLITVLWLSLTALLALFFAALATPFPRKWLLEFSVL